ncbi:conserved hypothetical Ustilaginaceae_specific protein [Sporisorium reilianum SRZ2]|uniref:Conserved hypothetical Ustilaginaceae_specific protein n=1 Tax=Sporisorium reilianum (strain SRZ2) TaxID=999809 RepID=E7A189_SPORE|nr:conserved hypothetical Ustilaginaceae_specific protein [Sporisorium reilianum SRZ2]
MHPRRASATVLLTLVVLATIFDSTAAAGGSTSRGEGSSSSGFKRLFQFFKSRPEPEPMFLHLAQQTMTGEEYDKFKPLVQKAVKNGWFDPHTSKTPRLQPVASYQGCVLFFFFSFLVLTSILVCSMPMVKNREVQTKSGAT